MTTVKTLDEIRNFLVFDIIRNGDLMWDETVRDTGGIDLLSVIATLYNLLHKEVTGEDYEYFFHWANKIGGYVEDMCFDEIGKYKYDNVDETHD